MKLETILKLAKSSNNLNVYTGASVFHGMRKMLFYCPNIDAKIKQYIKSNKLIVGVNDREVYEEFIGILFYIYIKYYNGFLPLVYTKVQGFYVSKCISKLDFEDALEWIKDYGMYETSYYEEFYKLFNFIDPYCNLSSLRLFYLFDCFIDKFNKNLLEIEIELEEK